MGIAVAEKKEQKGPECPFSFIHTHEKYRQLKFIQRDNGDSITLYPRDMLSWQDVNAFRDATGHTISILEAEIIMGIDGIFEGRNDV